MTEGVSPHVALRTDAYYRSLAESALRAIGADEPPPVLEAIAEAHGVPIYRTGLPQWFAGAIVYEDGLPVILLNDSVGEIDKRRTLGHLLGHILIVLEDGAPFPREAPEHRGADVIAEEMVLPAYMVEQQARKWFNDYRYLARLFGVSESEMLDKMHAMGLLKRRGTLWDY